MTKAVIAIRIHQDTGISIEEAAKFLDHVLELLKTTLQTGEPITISGFGKFAVRQKRARPDRNPQTGEPITISPRRVVPFLASDGCKADINTPSAAGEKEVA